MGLYGAIDDRRNAARAAAFLALIGIVNVPIVHFSVNWWNTLHQGATIRLIGPSTIDASMIAPLLFTTLGTKLWFIGSLLARTRTALTDLELGKDWVRRSEEHTSELQSLLRISYAVFCLKKKKKADKNRTQPQN